MARKITEQIEGAIRNRNSFTGGNTWVTFNPDGHCVISLHGNTIARYNADTRRLTVTNCGYHTNVTKDRLNAVLRGFGVHYSVVTRNYKHIIRNNWQCSAEVLTEKSFKVE